MATGLLDFGTVGEYVLHVGGARLDFDSGVPIPDRQATFGGTLFTFGGGIEGLYAFPYFAQVGGALFTLGGGLDSHYDVNVWRGLHQPRRDEYRDGPRLESETLDEWNLAGRIETTSSDTWNSARDISSLMADGWAPMPPFRADGLDEWGGAPPLSLWVADTFSSLPRFLIIREDGWQAGAQLGAGAGDSYIDLPRYSRRDQFRWGAGFPLNHILAIAWEDGLDILRIIPDEWDDGGRLKPGRTPWPPPGTFPITPILKDGRLEFGFHIRPCYLIMNTASLTRLPDHWPIPCSSIRISYDWDSWDVQITATLLGQKAYDDLQSAEEVELSINGHIRKAKIDKITVNRTFGSTTFQLSASTLAVELALPRAQSQTYSNSANRTVAQLADTILTDTGWTASWMATDWLVPAGLWNEQAAPITALSNLAEVAGAFLLPHPSDRLIKILPRYATLPWNWDPEVEPVVLSSITRQLGLEPVELPPYNAVFVAGESSGGILGHCVVDGTAGDIVAPMVVNPLICHVDAARARGQAILAETGRWAYYRIQIPITEVGGAIPLLEIGIPIAFLDATAQEQWPGLVTGTNITAEWKTGLRLTQELTVRRWLGT